MRIQDLAKMEGEADGLDLMPSFVHWTYNQVYQEHETSHRKFWRERLMPEHIIAGREGRAKTLPCEEGSYWRGFALTEMDKNKYQHAVFIYSYKKLSRICKTVKCPAGRVVQKLNLTAQTTKQFFGNRGVCLLWKMFCE